MGRLLEFILFAVVAYFVFKFLNRLFSPNVPSNNPSKPNQFNQQQKPKSSLKKDINWDAETVDYEEIETKKENEKN